MNSGPRPQVIPLINEEWRVQAGCLGLSADMFFPPERGTTGTSWSPEPAKAVCAKCPVRRECLDYVLNLPNSSPGVWGGTSERERRRMSSRRLSIQREVGL